MTLRVDAGKSSWRVTRHGRSAGELHALRRPDGRRYLFFRSTDPDMYGVLVDAAIAALDADLYVEADQNDDEVTAVLAERGFSPHRKEHRYVVPTDPAVTGLPVGLDGFDVLSAVEADSERWRLLDDRLRQEVPGAGGWRNDPVRFVPDTFADPEFDPELYLIAVDPSTGEYAGLVRVWNRPARPRLGLIGTAAGYRRRGVARGLLGEALAVLHRRGHREVGCEVDEFNTASNALLTGVGARREGGNVELLRRRASL